MARTVSLVCFATALLLSEAANSDTLKFTNGGVLKGTVKEVTFLADGKETKHAGDSLISVWISKTAKDFIRLADGTKLEGELIALKFRSVGGALVFERNDVSAVALGDPKRDKAKREFAAKRAALAADDANGLLELAQWCRTKGLKDESIEAAEACLKADPNGKSAKKAHALLGHVYYGGEWITPAEMVKRKPAKRSSGQPDETIKTPEKVKTLTPQELASIKAALAKNKELYKTYTDRVSKLKNQELGQARTKYGRNWDSMTGNYKALKATIGKKEKARETAKSSGGYTSSLTGAVARGRSKPNDGLEKDKERLKKLRRDMLKLNKVMKSAKSSVSSQANKRASRVKVARMKHKRLLLAGKLLSEDDLVKGYEAALKVD